MILDQPENSMRKDEKKEINVHDDETPFTVILQQFLQSLNMESAITHVQRPILPSVIEFENLLEQERTC